MGNIDWKDKKNIYAIVVVLLILAGAYYVYTYIITYHKHYSIKKYGWL